IGSREPARAIKLSRRVADRMAGFLVVYCMVDRAIATAGDFAFRAGVPRGNGPEPDRGVAAKTSRSTLRRCHPLNFWTDRGDNDDHRVCDSPVNEANAGANAKRAWGVARHRQPHRRADAKLS